MKKKFGLLIAILLCVALVLTFVSCGNKNNETTGGDSEVAESVIAEKAALIDADIQKWMQDNRSDTVVDLSDKLKKRLESDVAYYIMTSKMESVAPTVGVTFNKNTETYTVNFIWKTPKGTTITKTFNAKRVAAEYNGWAGSFKDGVYDDVELDDILDTEDKLGVLDNILDSTFAMVNKTVTDSVTGKFGVQGTLGVEFGDSNYGIDVKGNIDLTASEENGTEFAIVAKNGDTAKKFGGLYYANGATAEACRLYVGYLDEDGEMAYKYIDYAILNKLFNMIGVKFNDDKGDVIKSKAARPNSGTNLLFELIGLDTGTAEMVSGIIGTLIDAYETTTEDNETISVIDINFGTLLSTLSSYGSMLNTTVKAFVQDTPFKDLDLTTMHGIVGHITIITIADEDGRLTDFELAINVPKCTFYLCEDETKTHFDIPAFSVALYAKDFILSADETIEDVIPEKAVEEAEYFSPTNFNIQGDVTVEDAPSEFLATFRYHLVTEVNPFKPSEAKASFTILQTNAREFDPANCTTFLKITYDQKTKIFATGGTAYEIDVDGDGKITAVDGEKAYITTFAGSIMEEIKTWLGMWDDEEEYNGFGYDRTYGYFYVVETESYNGWEHLLPSAKALIDSELGRYLLEQHKARKMSGGAIAANGNAGESDLTGGNTETGEEEKSITDLIGDYYNKVSGLINKIKDENIRIKDGGFTFSVTAEQLNAYADDISDLIDRDFIAFLNRNIPGAKIPETITDPSIIELKVNTEDHQKQLYLTFTYADDVYELTFDAFVEDQFAVYFKLVKADKHVSEGGTKTFTFDLVIDAEEGTITATYKKDGRLETEVTHKNFEIDWGGRNTDNLEMYEDSALAGEAAGQIFDPSGSADCIGTKLIGGLMKFLNQDIVYPVSKFLVRQLVKLF